MRPEMDQLPGSCKNWFPVSRWVDVANDDYGVTWITLDAPMIEVGGPNGQDVGLPNQSVDLAQACGTIATVYSWAMNNHWGTNYRAYQQGLVTFRFILRPHRGANHGEATRLALARVSP